jgi:hypothetical protein
MNMAGEAISNWLSDIFEEKRHQIDRILPVVERRAERDAIVAAIKQHPDGEPLAAQDNLDEVIMLGLGIANKCEREAKKNANVMTASPAIQASWFVFDELDLPHPVPAA